jgi:steroid 5-alpha reductase family enzyme
MHEMAAMWHVAAFGLALTAVLAVSTWVASLVQADVSLVDRMWPIFIAGAGCVYFVLLPTSGARSICMIAVAVAWALRLSLFITVRNWGHGEDRRYQEIRARNQPNFGIKSLYLIFALQAVLAWVVSASLFAGMAAAVAPRPLGWLDGAGLAIAVFGIVFEAIGDQQMATFKSDAAHKGQVMDRGLWRYTRHPNYFGEACVWWGLWLMAMSAGGLSAAWSVVSPLLMTVLLLKVSGVALLEKDIAERRPKYREYVARTNAFVPGPPRKSAS